MISPTQAALAAVSIALFLMALGAYVEHVRMSAVLARTEIAHAEELAQYTVSLVTAAQATDAAVLSWSQRVKQSEATANGLRVKLSKLERRACLSADAVRLLNAPPSVPTSTERATGSTAATPADPAGYASTHAVSIWAAEVIQRYEDCRAQVDGIRAWASELR